MTHKIYRNSFIDLFLKEKDSNWMGNGGHLSSNHKQKQKGKR